MLFKCKECEKEISHSAGACPNCGCKKPFSKSQVSSKDTKDWDRNEIKAFTRSGGTIKVNTKLIKWFFGIIAISFIGLMIIAANEESKLTPEQRLVRDKERALAKERAEKEEKENERSVMSAEFYSMSQCLDGIRQSSGFKLKVVTDKPDEVSGVLSNGEGFACQEKQTGTKGTFYEGWYFKKGE